MTILLYTLLFIFFLIEAPLIALMVYLYQHVAMDIKTAQMRGVIFTIACGKALFIFAQIILVFYSIVKVPEAISLVIWSYSISAILLAGIDWWAFFRIRKILL